MEDYDPSDSPGLIDHLQPWDEDIVELLEKFNESAEECLDNELTRINQQFDARDEIHEEIIEELEWKVEWYTDRLESLYKTGRGRSDGERVRLQDRIEAFYYELRQEERQHWVDRQELEQERPDILHELAELKDTEMSVLL